MRSASSCPPATYHRSWPPSATQPSAFSAWPDTPRSPPLYDIMVGSSTGLSTFFSAHENDFAEALIKGRRVRQGRLAGIFESADDAKTQVEIGRKAAHVAFDLLLGDAQLIESEAPAHLLLLLAFSMASCRPTGCNWPTC